MLQVDRRNLLDESGKFRQRRADREAGEMARITSGERRREERVSYE